MDNSQRLVIVTGGSRGLGLGIVKSLLSEGYMVATNSRHGTAATNELAIQFPHSFRWFQRAIGNEAEETAFFEEAIDWDTPVRLHGLVNNAAIAGEGILATFPNVDSCRILETNLLGALRLARLAMRELLKWRGGRIINISSIVGQRGYTGLAAYSASKAGLDGLTRSLSREVGRRGVTVNSVSPGFIATDLSSSLGDRQRQQIINRTPLGRLGTVDDIVPLIRFLLSEDARFITGQTITIDGGISN